MKAQSIKFIAALGAALIFGVLFSDLYDFGSNPGNKKGDVVDVV